MDQEVIIRNVKRGIGFERDTNCFCGIRSGGLNPMSVASMKQGWKGRSKVKTDKGFKKARNRTVLELRQNSRLSELDRLYAL